MSIRLGVNIDHVATLRNARGEKHPDPYSAALSALKYGADSITIHLREDRRHINDVDLKKITKNKKIPTNLEMAANEEMLKIAIKSKPNFVCIVPEKRQEITTEGGLNLKKNFKKIMKKDDYSFYLIISFITPFLIFELIPTKLPHYVFPSYLPLSILIARNVVKVDSVQKLLNFSTIPLLLFPLSILVMVIYAVFEYSNIDAFFLINIFILLLLICVLLWFKKKKNIRSLIIFAGIFQIANFLILVFFLIPKLDRFWISKKINNIIVKYEKDVDQTFTFGFNEPSLLFLTSHKAINNSFSELTNEKIKNTKILLIVTGEFINSIESQIEYESFKIVDHFSGFNYSRGHNLEFKAFKN